MSRHINKLLPHGKIQKLFDNIWFVQGQVKMPMLFPMKISRSMTIIRNPHNNELTLINSMPLDDQTLNDLIQFGEIKNTMRIGGFHGRDDLFYKVRFGARVHALKGHSYSKKLDKIPIDEEKGYLRADIFLDEESDLPFPNGQLRIFKSCRPQEAILFIDQYGGILVSGDSLQNTATPDRFCNWPARIVMKKMGFYRPYNLGPAWLQFAKPELEEIRAILNWQFDNVLPGHGDAVIGDAKQKYRPVLENEIHGCH